MYSVFLSVCIEHFLMKSFQMSFQDNYSYVIIAYKNMMIIIMRNVLIYVFFNNFTFRNDSLTV